MTTKITHPSMRVNKTAQTTGNKPEVFVVEDASNDIQRLDDKLRQFERAEMPQLIEEPVMQEESRPIENLQPVSAPVVQNIQPQVVVTKQSAALAPELKRKAESLIFFGKIIKDVEIAGHKYQLSTLTSKEQTEILKALYSVADAADLFTVRSYTLANALKSVDGMLIDEADVFEDETPDAFPSRFYRRVAVVDNMQLMIIEKLYNEYNELIKESESMVTGSAIKK